MSNQLTASAIGAQRGSAIASAPALSEWRLSFVRGFHFQLLILVLVASRMGRRGVAPVTAGASNVTDSADAIRLSPELVSEIPA
jgi:hypothetical protein